MKEGKKRTSHVIIDMEPTIKRMCACPYPNNMAISLTQHSAINWVLLATKIPNFDVYKITRAKGYHICHVWLHSLGKTNLTKVRFL